MSEISDPPNPHFPSGRESAASPHETGLRSASFWGWGGGKEKKERKRGARCPKRGKKKEGGTPKNQVYHPINFQSKRDLPQKVEIFKNIYPKFINEIGKYSIATLILPVLCPGMGGGGKSIVPPPSLPSVWPFLPHDKWMALGGKEGRDTAHKTHKKGEGEEMSPLLYFFLSP